MEEKEIEVNGKKIKIALKVPKEYIEDNNLKVFLDETITLEEVVSKINQVEDSTNEININE